MSIKIRFQSALQMKVVLVKWGITVRLITIWINWIRWSENSPQKGLCSGWSTRLVLVDMGPIATWPAWYCLLGKNEMDKNPFYLVVHFRYATPCTADRTPRIYRHRNRLCRSCSALDWTNPRKRGLTPIYRNPNLQCHTWTSRITNNFLKRYKLESICRLLSICTKAQLIHFRLFFRDFFKKQLRIWIFLMQAGI